MSATELIEEQLQQTHYQPPRRYQVILHNDDFTPMDFVVDILMRYFKKDIDQATEIMLRIHHQGSAICGVYSKEIAETKVSQVSQHARKEGFPLLVTAQPEQHD